MAFYTIIFLSSILHTFIYAGVCFVLTNIFYYLFSYFFYENLKMICICFVHREIHNIYKNIIRQLHCVFCVPSPGLFWGKMDFRYSDIFDIPYQYSDIFSSFVEYFVGKPLLTHQERGCLSIFALFIIKEL